MPSKIWTFELEDGTHTVELEYSLVSARERFFVDDQLISDELRWVFVSRYAFRIGFHECRAVLRPHWTGMFWQSVLTVDGRPVEMLPSRVLLRPAQATEAPQTSLLRPACGNAAVGADQLLRASEQGEQENTDSS